MNWVSIIRDCFESKAVLYSRHARTEMANEPFGEIVEREVYDAICSCEVIQEYPDDKPYPSVLLFGRTVDGRPLHIVCAYNQEENLAFVVTVYHPNPELWIDFRKRKLL